MTLLGIEPQTFLLEYGQINFAFRNKKSHNLQETADKIISIRLSFRMSSVPKKAAHPRNKSFQCNVDYWHGWNVTVSVIRKSCAVDSRPVVNNTNERGLRKYSFSMHAAHFWCMNSSQQFVTVAHFGLQFGALAQCASGRAHLLMAVGVTNLVRGVSTGC
jgi:hypothetical protein